MQLRGGKKVKKILIGPSDFKKVIESDYYYIDKTLFIEEILKRSPEVLLITRPRRFGKTLNMSTLKYFFDIKNAESNRELFNGLKIEKTEYISHQGRYPVISLTMKDLEGSNYELFCKSFQGMVSELYRIHKSLREFLDERDLEKFDKIWFKRDDAEYSTSLKFLSELLYEHYGVKPILLIDEYDSPFTLANDFGYYKDAKTLIGTFYGSALKDGTCSFAVVTGILKVAKESIFSTLNNLNVSTVLTGTYNYFGMSEEEVRDVLKYFGWETTLEDTKKWYNGYLFGEERVYNPWSIMKHCENGKLEPNWINTSSNLLIKEILRDADKTIQRTMDTLIRDEKVKVKLDESMIYGEKYSDATLLYLMFSSGYLTIDSKGEGRGEYYLTIPNYEVKEYFSKTFTEIMTTNSVSSFSRLEEALLIGDTEEVEELIQGMFMKTISYMDITREEKFYHNIMMVMMSWTDSKFNIYSNRESGLGRYDLALEPKNPSGIGYIFEFKAVKLKKSKRNELEALDWDDDIEDELLLEMDRLGDEALAQIDRKKYEQDMRNRGISKIIKVGMVFCGKIAKLYTK